MENNSAVQVGISKIAEYGLFSMKNFNVGDTVFVLDGQVVSNPTRESIHIGNNIHIHDIYGAYINHSFDPSCKIEGKFVIAIKQILIGDEITFNYNESEINMASPFIVNGIEVKGKQT